MKWKNQSAYLQIKSLSIIAAAMLLGMSQSVWAAGTASSTIISNSASLSYTVGGTAQTPVTSDDPSVAGIQATSFVVDNKINLTVAKVDAARVSAVNNQVAATPLPNPPAYLTFTVTNNGNTTQDFKLTTTNPVVGSTDPFTGVTTFATSACRVFLESNANTTLQIGTDTEVSYINNLVADASQRVYLVCNTPLAATNGQTGTAGLVAEAVDATGTVAAQSASYTNAQLTAANTQAGVEIVAADIAGTETPVDGLRDAKHSASDTYIIATAVLSVNKTVSTICDPFNGNSSPKNIPGTAVQYAITIINSGSASATLSQVTDTLQLAGVNGIVFDPKLNSGATPASNCVSGNAANSLSATGFAAVTGAGTGPGFTAPGVAANATTAGATVSGQAITIDYPTLATSAITAPAGATLAAASYITVYFNAFIQ
ncbi:MAG: hypothetical protein H7Z70_05200 [Bacteroidia bacterium]|nr:hypothetical protein [Methylotenera sp.]